MAAFSVNKSRRIPKNTYRPRYMPIVISYSREISRDFMNLRSYIYSPWTSEHSGEKTEQIGPILRKVELF